MFEDKISTFCFAKDDTDPKARSIINYDSKLDSHNLYFFVSIFKPTKPNLSVQVTLRSENFSTSSESYISIDSVVKSKKSFFLTIHDFSFKEFIIDSLDVEATLTLYEEIKNNGEVSYSKLDSKTAYCSFNKIKE